MRERIQRELECGGRDYCFVGQWEINELWPEEDMRRTKIQKFAAKNGFILCGYENGLGAVFVRR
jgi:hypothetical protein